MKFEIVVNGEARGVHSGDSVEAFLRAHGIDPDLVVVERNGAILRRAEHGRTGVEAGDTLEIVHFVGGG